MMERRLNIPKITQRLAEMNLTMEDFKDSVKLDRRTVERLLSGKTKNARRDTVKMLAEFLGVGAQRHPDASLTWRRAAPLRSQTCPAVEMRLPVTGTYLVGRAQEVARLDRAWSCRRLKILSIVAWGGIGKSALVNHWVGTLAHDGWRGADGSLGGRSPVKGCVIRSRRRTGLWRRLYDTLGPGAQRW